MKRLLLLLVIASMAAPASADPPRHRWNQANCPKGFYKYRGDCWRKIDGEQLDADEDSFDFMTIDQLVEEFDRPALEQRAKR